MSKPYQDFRPARLNVNGVPRLLFRDEQMQGDYLVSYPNTSESLGMVALSVFREDPDYDYIGVSYSSEDGKEDWTLVFEQYELLTWMGGVALGRERQHILHHAERNNGSFRDRYGWNPCLVIEDAPSELEREYYATYLISKDKPEDLFKEPEESDEE